MLGTSPLTSTEMEYREALRLASLREAFTVITREKTAMMEENRRLRAILDAHGIHYDFQNVSPNVGQPDEYHRAPEVDRFGATYDEIGIDFVLA